MKGSVLIGQSGGPTAVINASLQGIIEEAFKNPLVTNVYGALNGIDGILNHQIIDFKYETKENLSLSSASRDSTLPARRAGRWSVAARRRCRSCRRRSPAPRGRTASWRRRTNSRGNP